MSKNGLDHSVVHHQSGTVSTLFNLILIDWIPGPESEVFQDKTGIFEPSSSSLRPSP